MDITSRTLSPRGLKIFYLIAFPLLGVISYQLYTDSGLVAWMNEQVVALFGSGRKTKKLACLRLRNQNRSDRTTHCEIGSVGFYDGTHRQTKLRRTSYQRDYRPQAWPVPQAWNRRSGSCRRPELPARRLLSASGRSRSRARAQSA
jgi:hypothetical protein